MPTGQTDISPWTLVAILAITALIFLPALDNGLTNWDDPEYLAENPLIQGLSPDSIKGMFTKHLNGKYHPLTQLTYTLEYHWFGPTPRIYHLNNLLLHLMNVALVFALTRILFREPAISLVTTVLFAVHPMHVEPVAWIAARKDVLSTLFYLAALLFWIGYLRNLAPKRWFYILTFFSSILAILAKASAVTIPLVLILLDYYFQRPINRKMFAEKIPFLACAAWLGSLTWTAVETSQAFPATGLFGITDRLFLSLYAIFLYLRKLIFPVTISCFYPLPAKGGLWFPLSVYAASAAVVLGGWLLWEKRRNVGGEILFAVLFFVIQIVPMLHLAKINDSIIYDRFAYLPSLGIFLLLAKFYCRLVQGVPSSLHLIDSRRLIRTLFPVYLLSLSLFSWQHVHIWKNSYTLWSDVIRQFPKSALGYYNRAHALTEAGRYDLALKDASQAVRLAPHHVNSYLNRGRIYANKEVYELALMDFSRAVRLAPENPMGYLERGNILLYFHQHDPAIQDFTTALRLDPRQSPAYNNRGNIYLLTGRHELAMADYTKALEIDPLYTDAYVNRAMAHLLRREILQALADLNTALRLDPANVLARQKKVEILSRP